MDKIILLELDMKLIGPQYGIRALVAPTENICLFALDLLPIYAEYELET
jgi:hypothetical protein